MVQNGNQNQPDPKGHSLSDTKPQPGSGRLPLQQRGRLRREALLDAAAAIIANEGVAGATMHAIARRAESSIGSMYHFFPDRESVLVAVQQRHERRLTAIQDGIASIGDDQWRSLEAPAVIETLFGPLLHYVVQRPDVLTLLDVAPLSASEQSFLALIKRVVGSRIGQSHAEGMEGIVAMFYAIIVGAFDVLRKMPGQSTDQSARRVLDVMAAYLRSLERP